MAENVLNSLLAEMQVLLTEYEQAYQAALSQLEQIEQDRLMQVGVVRGIEMAIERLAGQPAQGD